jgi:hypothetical protein
MSNHDHYIKDFPGDGEPNIELHHGTAEHWSKKMTAWSLAMIAIAALLAIFAVVLAASSNK